MNFRLNVGIVFFFFLRFWVKTIREKSEKNQTFYKNSKLLFIFFVRWFGSGLVRCVATTVRWDYGDVAPGRRRPAAFKRRANGGSRNVADTGPRTDELRIFLFLLFILICFSSFTLYCEDLVQNHRKKQILDAERKQILIFVKILLIFTTFLFVYIIYLNFDIFGQISLLKSNFSQSYHYLNKFS